MGAPSLVPPCRAVAAVCLSAALLSACGVDSTETPTAPAASPATFSQAPDPAELSPVFLPDLSMISESARRQLDTEYAQLVARRQEQEADAGLGAAYGELGQLLLAAGFRDLARVCFLNAQVLAPADARWLYYLGHLHHVNGDLHEALGYFARALELRPDEVAVLLRLGQTSLDLGLKAEAEQTFTRALALEQRSASARLGLGQVALARREYGIATKHLEQALSIESTAGAIHHSLGMAYRGTGDLERAEEHLRRSTSGEMRVRDPFMEEIDSLLETATAHEIRGGRALEEGDFPLAADHFRKSVDLAPSEPVFRQKLAMALALGGDASGAQHHLEEVVRRWPTFAKGHYSLGLILLKGGRPSEAIEHFISAVEADPADIPARLQLAEALRAVGRFEESLSHYEQASARDPGLAAARFGRAMALVGLKRYRAAHEHLVLAMDVFPEEVGFAHAAARLLAAAPDDGVRDGQRALAIIEVLVRERRSSVPLTETMAMALAEVGRYTEAAGWQRDAIDQAHAAAASYLMPRLAENLRFFERGQPCRIPFGPEIAVATL